MEGNGETGLLGRAAIEAIARGVCEGAGVELSTLLGVAVEFAALGIEDIAAEAVAEADDPIVVVPCRAESTHTFSIQLVVPRPLAAILAGLQQDRSLAELESAGNDALDAEALGALRGALRIVVASVQQTLGEQLEGALEIRDALEVEEPASDPTWLDGSTFQRARFAVRIEGSAESSLDMLFPSVAIEEGQEEVEWRILVLDDDPESEDLLALGSELGCSVDIVTPAQIREQGLEGLTDATAILIPWEIGGTPGIDTVERLAAHEAMAGTALLMTHPHPTRAMVLAALSSGATSFAMQPLAADELRMRIGLNRGASPPPERKDR